MGRIFKTPGVPQYRQWMWASGHGYEPTCEAGSKFSSRHSWTRRRNSSKRSAKAAELCSESVAGAMRVTDPSSRLKVVCNIPVLGRIAGMDCRVRVAGFTAVALPGWACLGWGRLSAVQSSSCEGRHSGQQSGCHHPAPWCGLPAPNSASSWLREKRLIVL